ncbi:MAG: hypothetical protein DCC65_02415 [Planctomycetota bacterium]|nr:MAG: hypothetical protein DCC65_02415 [Planctomycetota bacterium]
MTNPNPLHLANTAQNMARNAPQGDANAFHKIAMISMGVMAASSVVQTLQPLLRDLLRKESEREPRHGRHR